MVNEELRLSKRGSHPPSNKNAKDKSNSWTLRVTRQTRVLDNCSERGSEKDSGYSDDGSDWKQTNAEDQQSNKSHLWGAAEVMLFCQSQTAGQGKAGTAKRIPKGQPIYIMNNIVLNQPETIQTNGKLLWRNGPGEGASSGSPHMILLQQPILMPTAIHLLKSPSWKSNHATGKKVTTTYLPILNSYPRIAPHPTNKPPDKPLLIDEAQNLSKRVCTEHNSAARNQETAALEQSFSSSSSSNPAPGSSYGNPPSSVSSSSSIVTSKGPQRSDAGSTRHRRFLNTVEVLQQSGLLDITLRTKELLRQSNSTEREIAQLRKHTELLCQAAGRSLGGGAAATTWQSVHRTMTESKYYPGLKNLQYLQSPSYQVPELVAKDGVNVATIPGQNCDVTQQSDTEPHLLGVGDEEAQKEMHLMQNKILHTHHI